VKNSKARQGSAAYAKAMEPEAEKPGLLKVAQGEPGTKFRKVAKLLIVLGPEDAAKILAGLDADQVEKISAEIALIRTVDEAEARVLLDEFRTLFAAGFKPGRHAGGGIETARELLYAAFGPEKGAAYLRKAVPESVENPFGFMEDFSGDQIGFLLKDEGAGTLALVLSRLSAKMAAATLAGLEASRRLDVVRRIATLDVAAPEVLEQVAAALREKARSLSRTDAGAPDGRSTLAAILRFADPSFGDQVLEDLEDLDPELGRDLKDRLYTLEDVVQADERPLQEKLRSMADRDIALLLKGRSAAFTDKIRSCLSATRRALLEEERSLLGPVPKKEAEAAAKEFLAWFRLGRQEGRITMMNDEDLVL